MVVNIVIYQNTHPKGDAMWLDFIICLLVIYLLLNYHQRIERLEKYIYNRKTKKDENLSAEIDREVHGLMDTYTPPK